MPQIVRHYCSRCKQSIYNCMIDDVRVPIVVYFVAGQPDDSGGTIDLNAPGVKVPSFLRALMTLPVARIELCVRCLAEVFALPLLESSDDPMGTMDTDADGIPDLLQKAQEHGLGAVSRSALATAPVYDAIRSGHTQAFQVGVLAALVAAGITDPAAQHAALATALTQATTNITVGGPTVPVADGPSADLPIDIEPASAPVGVEVPSGGVT